MMGNNSLNIIRPTRFDFGTPDHGIRPSTSHRANIKASMAYGYQKKNKVIVRANRQNQSSSSDKSAALFVLCHFIPNRPAVKQPFKVQIKVFRLRYAAIFAIYVSTGPPQTLHTGDETPESPSSPFYLSRRAASWNSNIVILPMGTYVSHSIYACRHGMAWQCMAWHYQNRSVRFGSIPFHSVQHACTAQPNRPTNQTIP